MTEIARNLRFEDNRNDLLPDSDNMSNKMLSMLQEELQHLETQINQHFRGLQDFSTLKTVPDLKRYKKQFQLLKSSYNGISLRYGFLSGLPTVQLQDMQPKLANLEKKLSSCSEELKDIKQENEQAKNSLTQHIMEACNLKSQVDSYLLKLKAKHAEMLSNYIEHQTSKPAIPNLITAETQEQTDAMLQNETALSKSLQSRLSTLQDDLYDCNTAISAEEEKFNAISSKIAQLKAQQQAKSTSSANQEQESKRCSEYLSLLSDITGVSILEIKESYVLLKLNPIIGASVKEAPEHTLLVTFKPDSSIITSVQLTPTTVDVSSILAASYKPYRGLPFLVQEVVAALCREL